MGRGYSWTGRQHSHGWGEGEEGEALAACFPGSPRRENCSSTRQPDQPEAWVLEVRVCCGEGLHCLQSPSGCPVAHLPPRG